MSWTIELTLSLAKILRWVLRDFPIDPQDPKLANLNGRERGIAAKVKSLLVRFLETASTFDIEKEFVFG